VASNVPARHVREAQLFYLQLSLPPPFGVLDISDILTANIYIDCRPFFDLHLCAARMGLGLRLDDDWASDWRALATAVFAIVSTMYLVLYRLQTVKKHPDEPPIIASAVPYVGHLLGMALQGGRYVKGIG